MSVAIAPPGISGVKSWEAEYQQILRRLRPFLDHAHALDFDAFPSPSAEVPIAFGVPRSAEGGNIAEDIVRAASLYQGGAFKTQVNPIEVWKYEGGHMVRIDNGKRGIEVTLPPVPESAQLFKRDTPNPQISYVKAGERLSKEPLEGFSPLTQVYLPTNSGGDTEIAEIVTALGSVRYALGAILTKQLLEVPPAARAPRVALLQQLKRSAAQLDLIDGAGIGAHVNCSVLSDDNGVWCDVGDMVLATVDGKPYTLTSVANWSAWVTPLLRRGGLRAQLVPTLQLHRWADGRLGLKACLRATLVISGTDIAFEPGSRVLAARARPPAIYGASEMEASLRAALSAPPKRAPARRNAVAKSSSAPAGGAGGAGGAAGGGGDTAPTTPVSSPKKRVAPGAPARKGGIAGLPGEIAHQGRVRSLVNRLKPLVRKQAAEDARAAARRRAARRVIDDEAEEADEDEEEDDEEDADEEGNLRDFVVGDDEEDEEASETEEDSYEVDDTVEEAPRRPASTKPKVKLARK